ncbi:MAG TPA: DHH family phosphoesterase [Candidatus Dormibacteraeota bacterium]|nr:DHH family phosphoesterase [Candidatus Dormibacteraeota bacterium]
MESRELTPKQQTSEAIRQSESILIITGQHPSVDQVSAAVALARVLRKLEKKTTVLVSDQLPAGSRFLSTSVVERQLSGLRDFIVQVDLGRSEVDKLKYTIEDNRLNVHITPFSGGFKPEDVSYTYGDYQFDIVIALGVSSYSRLERQYQQNPELFKSIPLVNIDYHRGNENFGAINLVEPAAASLSELIVALAESLQTGSIDQEIATALLAGIMAATDRFTSNHTTPKTLTVAAQMMAAGADQQQVVTGLYRGVGDKPKNPPRSNQSQSQSQTQPLRDHQSRPVERKEQTQPQPKPAPPPKSFEQFAAPQPEPSEEAPHPNQVTLTAEPEPLINASDNKAEENKSVPPARLQPASEPKAEVKPATTEETAPPNPLESPTAQPKAQNPTNRPELVPNQHN